MNTQNQFTIQLSNGKEESFDSAREMTAWLDRQRGLEYTRNRRRTGKSKVKRASNKSIRPRNDNESPLARYANRNSGEA